MKESAGESQIWRKAGRDQTLISALRARRSTRAGRDRIDPKNRARPCLRSSPYAFTLRLRHGTTASPRRGRAIRYDDFPPGGWWCDRLPPGSVSRVAHAALDARTRACPRGSARRKQQCACERRAGAVATRRRVVRAWQFRTLCAANDTTAAAACRRQQMRALDPLPFPRWGRRRRCARASTTQPTRQCSCRSALAAFARSGPGRSTALTR